MNNLSKVLTVKIVLTAVLWCCPLLLFPSNLLLWLGFPVPEPQIFLRLLGMAYLALIVGYAQGLRQSIGGDYPGEIVWLGFASNGGAFLLLANAAFNGVWAPWGFFAQLVMWCSLVATGCIALGLFVFGPLASRLAPR